MFSIPIPCKCDHSTLAAFDFSVDDIPLLRHLHYNVTCANCDNVNVVHLAKDGETLRVFVNAATTADEVKWSIEIESIEKEKGR